MSPTPKPLRERVIVNIRVDDHGCWLWQLATSKTGYGVIGIGRARQMLAHRVSYEAFVGPIPEGLQLDHLCRVRHCVNPEHLEPVTAKVNSERGWPAAKLHGVCGHELFGPNLLFNGGKRHCRTCRRASNARYRQQRGVAA